MKARRVCRESVVVVVLALMAVALFAVPARAQRADGPVPTVTGPVTGGTGAPNLVGPSTDLLGPVGYTVEEYFLSGNASAYTSAQPLTSDGEWTVTPSSTAPYTTRVVVHRPTDPKAFNGTVLVEWLNVSPGFDNAASYGLSHVGVWRDGAAWVGVSAQATGVQGGTATVGGVAAGGLKAADPARYGTLTHPGDSYSYDIFSQAGRAVLGEGAVTPLGDLRVKRVLAVGESQSASRMVTYINGVDPVAKVYDGFLVHSRSAGAAPLSQAPLPDIPAPVPTLIRADARVPVLVFNSETDVGPNGAAAARGPDTTRVRTWEVAGTAHADAYTGGLAFGDGGDGKAEYALLDYTNPSRGPLSCDTPVNMGPHYAAIIAATHHLDRWVRNGTPPPKSPLLEVTKGPDRVSGSVTLPTYVITRDANGIALGGIRTAFVDAPRAALTGELNSGGTFCRLFGTTTPFDDAKLAAMYPSRADFLAAFEKATKKSVKAGFILAPEAKRQLAAARQVPYPG